jgi:hypothetical protein
MRIAGEWFAGDDGESRPIVRVLVAGWPGQVHVERFLVDTGADRTVLSASLLLDLGLPVELPPPGSISRGISGDTGMVIANTMLEFTTDEGGPRGFVAALPPSPTAAPPT